MSRLLSLALGCLAGIATMMIGVWALRQELAPANLGLTSLERVINMTTPSSLAALSILSQNEALLNCADSLRGLDSLTALYLSEVQRARIVPNCLALTNHVIEQTPSHSYALFVRALTASVLSDWPAMSADLALSERTGPTEQWIGEQRVLLAAMFPEQLGGQARLTNDADLAMLVRSDRGIKAIAARYLSDAGFREHITEIVERLPAVDQQRFIDTVRRALRAMRNGPA